MKSFVLLAVTLCLGPLVLSAQTPATPQDQTVTGRVVSQTGDTLVVQLPSGERSVRLSSSLAIATPFAVGSQVTLTYREENGEWIASQVANVPAAVPSSSGATTSTASASAELPRTAGGAWTLAALGLGIAGLGLALKRAA
jgi:hypothetical protein